MTQPNLTALARKQLEYMATGATFHPANRYGIQTLVRRGYASGNRETGYRITEAGRKLARQVTAESVTP